MKNLPLFRVLKSTSSIIVTGAEMPLYEANALFNSVISNYETNHFEEISYLIIYCCDGEIKKYNGSYKIGYDYLSLFESIKNKEDINLQFLLSNEKLYKRRNGKEKYEIEVQNGYFNKDILTDHLKKEMLKQYSSSNSVS